ncbi:hypothetical protein OHA72_53125 [Dactylosporangium sp. NBC_01737]|uniref:hypothetical protein n=1 Tax=Dactylosporangium sp. NBC_01737 TaxID=2975959 RepID=UPI002E110411|nr:hypothetical protein OHA72_53125 [Dactylosporangium sp. NBC_01737]
MPGPGGGPGVSLPAVWAFGQVRWVDHPIGTTHDLAPNPEHPTNDESNWTYGPWRTGGPGGGRVATATHTDVGRQRIVLPGAGAPGGVAHATAYDYTGAGATCQPSAWHQDGIDEVVDVACFDRSGGPADVPVDVLFLAGTPAGGARGFVHAARPAASSYTPGAPDASNTGQVRRTGTGRYTVAVPSGATAVQVSPVAGAARYCAVAGVAGGAASVVCTGPGGAAQDTAFVLSHTGRESLLGDPRVPYGAFLTGAGTSGPGDWWAGKPGAVTVDRTGAGRYTVRLPVGQLPSYTHVTGRGPGHCGLVLRNDYGTKDAVVLHVACFAAAGAPADAAFDLTYATASPYE